MALDMQKLDAFLGRFVGDLGATFNAGMVVIGDQLGLYKALAGEPVSAAELASKTSTDSRYVEEWLAAQAASGYVEYDAATGRFSLSEEQAYALATEGSPAFIPGAFQLATAALKSVPKMTEAFRTGAGLGWHEHDQALFHGTERFFRPGYAASLVSEWIPALDGVRDRLVDGGLVADVGCGHGASTILLAKAFPRSTFAGSDYHALSIQAARKASAAGGVVANTTFEVAAADAFSGQDYDLICYFDCLHDMGDPVGALRHARAALGSEGVVMLVEPRAGDTVAENLNPVGRLFYAASTLICTPASQSQSVSRALGAQAGVARLTEVAREAGFSRVRQATSTPFNLVLELRA